MAHKLSLSLLSLQVQGQQLLLQSIVFLLAIATRRLQSREELDGEVSAASFWGISFSQAHIFPDS